MTDSDERIAEIDARLDVLTEEIDELEARLTAEAFVELVNANLIMVTDEGRCYRNPLNGD